MSRSVVLTVDVARDVDLPRVLEVLSNTLGGLLLEGLEPRLSSYTFEDDDE